MTFEELSNDTSFLKGLQQREFCLVLGAGFSFGLKNSTDPNSTGIKHLDYARHSNIPLVSSYIELTNAIFNSKVGRGETAANTWETNNFSLSDATGQIDLRSFYKNLFTLDKSWFRQNLFELYKSIFVPDWYQIYTFNFDDVLEVIAELQGSDELYSLHFPEHKGDIHRRTLRKAIHHLHGYIRETPPESLTFSQNTYDFLDNELHTLYDAFHVDVASGKKLVIIGCQFDERTIDRKFFDGLKNRNITIYHFSRDNHDFETKPGIALNPNYHFIKINDTSDVLSFFRNHKTTIDNIRVNGAELIDRKFIENVTEEGRHRGVIPSDFYLAKQRDDCQWYGVISGWNVNRSSFQYLKGEVLASFADSNRVSRIAALVCGKGGSGKSTMLRSLAVELSNEEFSVLWIKDKEIVRFHETGLAQIRELYQHRCFLVIIEDLYRVQQQDINLQEIIDEICLNPNVRMVVGDRIDGQQSYSEQIYNPDKNIIELAVDDNRSILTEILKIIPQWSTAASRLLTGDDDYKSTLYYLLWTIGRTAKMDGNENISKFHDRSSHFRRLIESDLKHLAKYYPGVAKMLHYWASLYSRTKIYIDYKLFFKLADLFNDPAFPRSSQLLASDSGKAILDIYSYKAEGFIRSAGDTQLFAFNHDILAEDGLSKVKLAGWHPFDGSIKLQMLPAVLDHGDAFSILGFTTDCLNTLRNDVFNNEKKASLVWELSNKGIFLYPALAGNFLSPKEKAAFATKVLEQDRFWLLPAETIGKAMKILGSKKKVDEVLALDQFWSLPSQIIIVVLNISRDTAKAKELLSQDQFWRQKPEVVVVALNITRDKTKADVILSQDRFWDLSEGLVVTALKLSEDKVRARQILEQNRMNTDAQLGANAGQPLESELNVSDADFKTNIDAMKVLIDQWRERINIVKAGGGPETVERHKSRGKLTARERIDALVDAGTAFMELSTLAAWDMYEGAA
ncbi:MAG: hypothetical protein EOP04_09670, partial [Proteobacteria bacterium]